MSARTNLTDLGRFLDASPEVEAATVARPSGEGSPEVRALSLANDAEDFFREVVAARVGNHIDPLEWSVKKLEPLYKPDPDEVEWERTDTLNPVAYAVDTLSNLSAVAPFDQSDESYKRRLLYWGAVLSGADGRQAFFFRSFTASSELKRKRGAALVARHGTFSVVEESIFLFDDQIDAFVFGDYVYVLRKRDFRRIFEQLNAVLRRAKRAARDLGAKIPIANLSEFQQACSTDSRLADKVLAVRGRDYFDRLSYEMLEPVITEFGLDIPTTQVDGETQLVFGREPTQRFRILKLVDDDYLRSSMTNHRYEVNSKTDPPTP